MSFFLDSSQSLKRYESGLKEAGDEYPCTVLQWENGQMTRVQIAHAHEIQAIKPSALCIIVAPADSYKGELLAGMRALFTKFDIPGAFLEERCQNVLNSFGHLKKNSQSSFTWLHFLLKKVEHEEILPRTNKRRGIWYNLEQTLASISVLGRKAPSQGSPPGKRIPFKHDDTGSAIQWLSNAYILHTDNVSQDARAAHSSGSTQLARRHSLDNAFTKASSQHNTAPSLSRNMGKHRVALICFGPPTQLIHQLESLPALVKVDDLLEHPFILWDIILYNLSMALDTEMWGLTEAFATEQKILGYLTGHPSKPLSHMEFSGLHLLADHMILLLEGANGLLATAESLMRHHEVHMNDSALLSQETHEALQYRHRFIRATLERGIAFDKRITNMISMFFSHVSLQDNGILMRDSRSLRSIALLTLVFLPVTTVATICGAEFVYTSDEQGSRVIRMHPTGWTVLTSSVIVTLVMVAAWFIHLYSLEKRYTRGQVHPPQSIKFPPGA